MDVDGARAYAEIAADFFARAPVDWLAPSLGTCRIRFLVFFLVSDWGEWSFVLGGGSGILAGLGSRCRRDPKINDS